MEQEKRSERYRKKQKQIRQAAHQLFLKHGFSETSMDMIRDLSGVSKQTLYVYYPSKEELFKDIIHEFISVISDEEPEIPLERLPMANRQELAQSLTQLALKLLNQLMQPDYLRLGRIVIAEVNRLPSLGRLFRDAVPLQALNHVAHLLQLAQRSGTVTVPDTQLAARAFIGPLITYVLIDGLLIGDAPPQPPGEAEVSGLVELYMKTLI